MSDAARFLADSPDRLALLERLRERPAGPATLADEVDCARRTVQRHLAAFEERGWVESGDGYRLTAAGDAVAAAHADYLDRLDQLERFAPLFSNLAPTHAPAPALLADADLVAAESADPQAPIQAYVERLRDFSDGDLKLCSPVLSRAFHDAHADLARRGVHTTLLLAEETAREARDRNPLEFAAVLRVGVVDLFARPEPLPFGLAVDGEQVLLAAYDDAGHLQACVHGDDPALVDWASSQFAALQESAERVRSPRDLDADSS
jgi:predicted transcriptional regulator